MPITFVKTLLSGWEINVDKAVIKEEGKLMDSRTTNFNKPLKALITGSILPKIEQLSAFLSRTFKDLQPAEFLFIQSVLKDLLILQPFTRPLAYKDKKKKKGIHDDDTIEDNTILKPKTVVTKNETRLDRIRKDSEKFKHTVPGTTAQSSSKNIDNQLPNSSSSNKTPPSTTRPKTKTPVNATNHIEKTPTSQSKRVQDEDYSFSTEDDDDGN